MCESQVTWVGCVGNGDDAAANSSSTLAYTSSRHTAVNTTIIAYKRTTYIRMFIISSSSIHPLTSASPISNPPLLGDTDNTASRPGTSVASLLALLVVALAEVVGAGVNNNSAAKNALRADQLDELVRDAARGVALGVGLEIAQVADVALAVAGGAVGLVVGVDCTERKKESAC
jgi:hypothetical protein